MKKLVIMLTAAGALTAAAPALAQVHIEAGPGGVGVGVGDGYYQGHRRGWRRGYAYERDCRVERTRIITPSGRVIVKTRRVCR